MSTEKMRILGVTNCEEIRFVVFAQLLQVLFTVAGVNLSCEVTVYDFT